MPKKYKYLILTFVITYLFWGFDIVLSISGAYEHPANNIGIILYIIAASAPAISVFIIMQSDPEKRGAGNFLKTSFRFNAPISEILLIVIFIAIRFGIPCLFGDVKVVGKLWQVIVFTPIMLLFGGLEEIGWRGFLQPNLEKKFGFFCAALINCAIWSVWHLPLCFIKGTYQYSGNYLWFVVSLTGTAFFLAVINKVRGSILPCIIFHSLGNAIVSYGISVRNGASGIVSMCVQIIFAVCVSNFCNKRLQNKMGTNK